ncbi:MAG: DNA polymerase III subunit beta [Tissierellales bacterium]|nr:DNA polymerase III subunit beta [Tissierellales bacterium]
MKLRITQPALAKAIQIVQKGISSKTTLPILTGILMEAKGDMLKLTGTDLELGIETFVPCDIEREGSVVVTANIFGEIIRKLPNSTIDLEVFSNHNILIECEYSEFNILGQSPAEYPKLPYVDKDRFINLPKDLFKTMIRQTVFAAAQDETRPILTGALLEVEESLLNLVALDGYRLAFKQVEVETPQDLKVVIPSKTLNEINKILEDEEENLAIYFTTSHILFNLGDTIITSRLLDGQFLNYKDIIRTEYKTRIKVKTKQLQSSIERASLLAKEGKTNLIKLEIKNDQVMIRSNSDIGKVQEEVPVELEGDDIVIAFNSRYLIDGLKAVNSEEIYMTFVSNVNPCIVHPINDEKYTYLILPVRIPD